MNEVIVIGAGPAGAASATILAKGGRDVLLIDQADFPRDKPCGDVVSTDAVKEIETLGAWTNVKSRGFRPVYNMEYFAPNGNSICIKIPQNLQERNFVAQRTTFDWLLKDNAERQGARFETARVLGPVIENSRVQGVIVKRFGKLSEVRARFVVAADGANSMLARQLRKKSLSSSHRAVAIRAYVATENELDHTIRAYFINSLLPGYAWAFPVKPNLLNIGVGTTFEQYKRIGKKLDDVLHDFLNSSRMKRFLGERYSILSQRGWMLNMGSDSTSRIHPGIIFAGDAGAFVSPASGAGIASALTTGILAGEVLLHALGSKSNNDRILTEFDRLCRSRLLSSFKRAYFIQNILLRRGFLIDWFISSANDHPLFVSTISKYLEKK